MVATVPEPRLQDDVALIEQVNWTFSIGCQTLASETRTITYDPTQGVRISRDPLGEEGGKNLYAFCLNSPINAYDPLGEAANWHHMLPQEFEADFSRAGLNIHGGRFSHGQGRVTSSLEQPVEIILRSVSRSR